MGDKEDPERNCNGKKAFVPKHTETSTAISRQARRLEQRKTEREKYRRPGNPFLPKQPERRTAMEKGLRLQLGENKEDK